MKYKEDEVFYSVDDEQSEDDLKDALQRIADQASTLTELLSWIIDVHKKRQPVHNYFVRADSILEDMACCASDEFSEHADDYLNDVIFDKEKISDLGKIISEWLDENASQPNFWISDGIIDRIQVTQELLDIHDISLDF